MYKLTPVKGKNKGKVVLYALSTCVWCKKTRELLDKLGVEYSYVYVDLLEGDDNRLAKDEVRKWNPQCSFPTIVINDTVCIKGFDEESITKELK